VQWETARNGEQTAQLRNNGAKAERRRNCETTEAQRKSSATAKSPKGKRAPVGAARFWGSLESGKIRFGPGF